MLAGAAGAPIVGSLGDGFVRAAGREPLRHRGHRQGGENKSQAYCLQAHCLSLYEIGSCPVVAMIIVDDRPFARAVPDKYHRLESGIPDCRRSFPRPEPGLDEERPQPALASELAKTAPEPKQWLRRASEPATKRAENESIFIKVSSIALRRPVTRRRLGRRMIAWSQTPTPQECSVFGLSRECIFHWLCRYPSSSTDPPFRRIGKRLCHT